MTIGDEDPLMLPTSANQLPVLTGESVPTRSGTARNLDPGSRYKEFFIFALSGIGG
jgi:hypothetical protein